MSYERTTKETIDSAFHIMKTITEDYKKRKGDPTLLRGPAEAPPASDSVPTDAEFFVRVAASAKPLQSKKKPNELVDNAEKSASKGNDNLSVTAPKPIVSQAVEPLPAQRKPSSNTSGQQMTVSTSGNADITGGPPAVNTTPSQTNPATNSLQQPTPRQ
ncbi:hypothetical protein ANCCAN_11955 [Ancylostoma caninum]|uniref:Uncharacterized protein n=1 Tax=Ancylostoma caninum TaxID=29170 RepID=A0A368GGF5_ANCCA|nr:hypothetical protein ANCCAN_11955 [Ancylostoma caninum]